MFFFFHFVCANGDDVDCTFGWLDLKHQYLTECTFLYARSSALISRHFVQHCSTVRVATPKADTLLEMFFHTLTFCLTVTAFCSFERSRSRCAHTSDKIMFTSASEKAEDLLINFFEVSFSFFSVDVTNGYTHA